MSFTTRRYRTHCSRSGSVASAAPYTLLDPLFTLQKGFVEPMRGNQGGLKGFLSFSDDTILRPNPTNPVTEFWVNEEQSAEFHFTLIPFRRQTSPRATLQ